MLIYIGRSLSFIGLDKVVLLPISWNFTNF